MKTATMKIHYSQKAAILRQMHYLAETDARLRELKTRIKNTARYVRLHQPMDAQTEIAHLHAEAHKLTLHLVTWEDYVATDAARTYAANKTAAKAEGEVT